MSERVPHVSAGDLESTVMDLIDEVRFLKTENDRLRAALRQYGRHLPTCEGSPGLGCTCGLNGALEGGE